MFGIAQRLLRSLFGFVLVVLVATNIVRAQGVGGDSYDDAGLIIQARAIHSDAIILDAHADIALPETSKLYLGTDGRSKVAPDKLMTGGVNAVVMALAVSPGPRDMAGYAAARKVMEQKLNAVRSLVSNSDGKIVIARSAADVENANLNDQMAVILGFQNARALGGDVQSLKQYYDAGARVFALNHLAHNAFADSSRPAFDAAAGQYEPKEEHGGLSSLGVEAVRLINALGGIVDISQTSKAGALQIIKLSETPVVASHSNVRTLSDVSRNLSDEEIDLIGRKGGVVHIAAFSAYLRDYSDPTLLEGISKARTAAGLPEAYSYPYELYWEIKDDNTKLAFLRSVSGLIGRSSVNRMVDHIDYIVDRIGIDHVGIGTDFNHGGGVSDFAEADQALNLTMALLRRGYSDADIKKIWSGNFLRVWRQAERYTKSQT